MTLPIETVLRDEELSVRYLPGPAARLVVVFTGMRNRVAGAYPAEFAASAHAGGNKVLFVTDRRMSWFAAPGVWTRIVELVQRVRVVEAVREVVTLGSSMGGFGAFLLARDAAVARAIAFSPQVTMDRGLLDDERWPDVAARWGRLPIRSLSEVIGAGSTRFAAIAAGGCAPDQAHLDLLPEHPRLIRRSLPGARHDVARLLKEAGLLPAVVSALVHGRWGRADRHLARLAAAQQECLP